jgi:hypothetical protein
MTKSQYYYSDFFFVIPGCLNRESRVFNVFWIPPYRVPRVKHGAGSGRLSQARNDGETTFSLIY